MRVSIVFNEEDYIAPGEDGLDDILACRCDDRRKDIVDICYHRREC